MTASPTDRESSSSCQVKGDDLTVIHGISPDRASRFRASGIDSLEKLAEVSDAQAETVAAEIKYVSPQMIKDWRADARERLSLPQDEEGTEPEIDAKKGQWRSIASFSVAFQSRQAPGQEEERRVQIAHRQGDGPEFFNEVEGDKPWRWIIDQLGEKPQPREAPQEEPAVPKEPAVEEEPAKRPPTPELSVQPEITKLRLFQPRETETPIAVGTRGDLFPGVVHASEPFALEASFTLRGSGAREVAERQPTCRARFSARSLPPGSSIHLGDAQFCAHAADESLYQVRLPKTSLPKGIYRLRIVVIVQKAGIASGYSDGPILQMV